MPTGSRGLAPRSRETPGRYDTRNFVWPVNDAVRELVFDSPLGEIAASVMRSTTASYLYDNFWVKEPHSESLTPWHQDQPYLQISGRQICNLWIGVDRATEDNGAVEFVRGSHSWGHIFEPEPFDGSAPKDARLCRERVPDSDNLRDAYDIIHFVTEPGDCIASHALMVHGAGPNRTDRVRRAISFNLFGDDARYALIPPGRGMEISLDYGLSEGDPFRRITSSRHASGPNAPGLIGPGQPHGAICQTACRPVAMRVYWAGPSAATGA